MPAIALARRNRPQRPRLLVTATTWLLIAAFLLQPVLAYLVTPVLTHDANGQLVVICTLQGEKIIDVDLPPIDGTERVKHCAAIKLYQMAGSVQASEPPTVPAVVLYSVELFEQTARHAHQLLHFSVYASRAPPAFS